jgi:hypothetical protein
VVDVQRLACISVPMRVPQLARWHPASISPGRDPERVTAWSTPVVRKLSAKTFVQWCDLLTTT